MPYIYAGHASTVMAGLQSNRGIVTEQSTTLHNLLPTQRQHTNIML
jgi:hypothetical protein